MHTQFLGQTDIAIPPLGMGTLTMGFSQRALSIEEGSALIVYAVERGIGFLDTAQYYDTYRYLRPALDTLRGKNMPLPVLSSKTLASSYAGAADAVAECLDALAIGRVDVFLLHEVRSLADFQQRADAWQALQDLRKAGKIRAIGISTHHQDVCLAMASEPNCDAIFALLNRDGLGIRCGEGPGSAAGMAEAIGACAKAGKGVFSMKAFGGGNLLADYQSCLDYATSVAGNQAVVIGMASQEQVDRACEYFAGTLAPGYTPDLSAKRMYVDPSDCEGCGTCLKRCVSGAITWSPQGLAWIDPDKCLRCGYCAPVCPVRAILLLEPQG